ncbi:Nucleic-acid-binding protein from transposon X-element, partial [Camponotus floridanus]
FYTFTPKKDKVISILLKGLHHSYDSQEILNELKSLKIEDVGFHKVTPFKTKRSVSENIQLPIFLVQLEAGSKIHNLIKINRLCHHIITWDKLKNKNIIQCKRCQRLGHVASNCNLKYRCVKCKDSHVPGECKLSPNSIQDKNQLYCANCQSYGHPASYRGCPILLNLKKRHK